MTRYVIIGAGAVGATLAAELHDAGVPHVLVGRGAHIAAIIGGGLRFNQHGEERVVPVTAAASADEVALTNDDVLVFATKTQDLEAASRGWAYRDVEGGTTASELPALTLQNGLSADEILVRRHSRVIGGSILTPARFVENGSVVSGALNAPGVITLGAFPAGREDDAVEAIARDLRRARYVVEVTSDVRRWQAAKILHSVKNGVEVLSGDDAEKAALGEKLVAEAREVLTVAGLDVADPSERTQDISTFKPDPAAAIPPGQQSTWQSFARGASSEVDFLNGDIVRLGRQHHVPTPYNAALQRVLGRAERLRHTPGVETVDSVLSLASPESGVHA